jgi:hypothetical protein
MDQVGTQGLCFVVGNFDIILPTKGQHALKIVTGGSDQHMGLGNSGSRKTSARTLSIFQGQFAPVKHPNGSIAHGEHTLTKDIKGSYQTNWAHRKDIAM